MRLERPYRRPAPTVALFGKKAPAKPAGPPKAKVKSLYGPTGRGVPAKSPSGFIKPKPAAKPAAKKAGAAKPAFSFGASKPAGAKKAAAKKAAAPKPLFSFGGSSTTKKAVGTKKVTVQKSAGSKYNIKKTAGTTIKKKPLVRAKPIATVNVATPPAAPKVTAPKEPREPTTYDKETVEKVGLGAVIAGGFLVSLAVLPAIVDTALEVIGVGYTAYFTYNYLTNSSSRDEFGKKLDEIEDQTGINLKKVAQVTGEMAEKTSKQLAESAEKAAEKRAATAAAEKKKADEAVASTAKADAPAAKEEEEKVEEA